MRRLVVLIIVVLVVLFGVDRLGWYLAGRVLANEIQQSQHLSSEPDVSIGGFPFLTQVVAGTYDEVDTDLSGLSVQNGVTVDDLSVKLAGAHVPLGDLLRQDVRRVPVDAVDATGTISYANLDAAAAANIPAQQLKISFGPGTDGRLKVTGSVATALTTLQLSGESALSVRGGNLLVTLDPNSVNLPSVITQQVAGYIGTEYQLPPLPFGLHVTGAAVGKDGVTVTAHGENTVLQETAATTG